MRMTDEFVDNRPMMTESGVQHPEINLVVPPVTMEGEPTGAQPRMRHLPDCGHFVMPDGTILGTPRLATTEEMRALPPCKDCISRTGSSGDGGHRREDLAPVGDLCPGCSVELPLTGTCDGCD